MSGLPRLLVILVFAGIVLSLGSALLHLTRGRAEDSRKMARALTLRIVLSLVLFALLMLAWYTGFITPHPMGPAPTP